MTRASIYDTQHSSSSTDLDEIEPLYHHPIDYSASNEFISEHYRHHFEAAAPNSDFFYFEKGADSGPFDEDKLDDGSKPIETVYNGRLGVLAYSDDGNENGSIQMRPTSIEQDGFTLHTAPTKVQDFTKLEQIKMIYLTELRQIVHDVVASPEELEQLHFWNPMFRGEEQSVTNAERDMTKEHAPTSPTAGMVHIDQDVGAYDTQDFVKLIQRNRIEDDFPLEDIVQAIDSGSRFAVVNFWRNADLKHPIQRQPLAVFSPYYQGKDNEPQFFPKSQPDPVRSKWYSFPEMNSDEVLIFKQYDRDGRRPSDIWHCALKSVGKDNHDIPLRKSFDIRALLVFKEKVQLDPKVDRFAKDRVRPDLSYEESGEFCDEQAKKRRAT